MERSLSVVAAAVVLLMATACSGSSLGRDDAGPAYSCSRSAAGRLAAVEAGLREAGVPRGRLARFNDCGSGASRWVEAAFPNDLAAVERFVREHFRCGPTELRPAAAPERVDHRGRHLNQPTRVLHCAIAGGRAEVTVVQGTGSDGGPTGDIGDVGDMASISVEPIPF
jgi:hypothetical protein